MNRLLEIKERLKKLIHTPLDVAFLVKLVENVLEDPCKCVTSSMVLCRVCRIKDEIGK